MVEESNSTSNTEQPNAASLENEEPIAGTVTAEAPKWITTNSEPLNEQEEADLAAFLTKVSAACKTDSSVPGFVDT